MQTIDAEHFQYGIEILYKEIRILEIKEQSEIYRNGKGQQQPPVQLAL